MCKLSNLKLNNWPEDLIDEACDIISHLLSPLTVPMHGDILNFMNVKPENIKIVILGQDPYPTPGVANGYAFAVNKGVTIPASLKAIIKEVKAAQGGRMEADETLSTWMKQGVLLLNTALTTEQFKPGAHLNYWKAFSEKIVKFINSQGNHIIWVLWGAHAKSYAHLITGKVITDAHPSPLAASYRKGDTFIKLKLITQIIF